MSKAAQPTIARKLRAAVYTRKSTEEGLDQEFKSLHAQRESCEAYVANQKAEGCLLLHDRCDDGGFSGGTLERPALKRLIADIERGLAAGIVDAIIWARIARRCRGPFRASGLCCC
jgi:DNA invertase Pin-like site-specific DNA recombinase